MTIKYHNENSVGDNVEQQTEERELVGEQQTT